MFDGLESGAGLDVVVWLQEHRSGLLDAVGQTLHVTGQTLFYIVLLALVFWCINKTLGRQLFFAVVLSSMSAELIKYLLQTPRPYLAYPDQVVALVDQPGYGFPSSHVTMSLVIWGCVALWLKRRWVWAAVGCYVLLMGWARMYTGVHYPQDVIGGIALGALVLWGYARVLEVFPLWWARSDARTQAIIVVLLGLAIALPLGSSKDGLTVSGAFIGGGLGIMVEAWFVRFSPGGDYLRRGLRFIVGLALVSALLFGLRAAFEPLEPEQAFRVLRYALVAGFGLAGWPWLSVRLGLASRAAH
jgi:membrane-associated phospholipid phosphatase